MRKLFLIVFIFLSLITFSYAADYTTDHYRMLVPEEGTEDWNSKISNDIISMDNLIFALSQDAAWINRGGYTFLRDYSELVGIGYSTPLVSLDVNGAISADCIRFDTQTASPDTATLKGAILVVSQDPAGTVTLNFYTGSQWRRVTFD